MFRFFAAALAVLLVLATPAGMRGVPGEDTDTVSGPIEGRWTIDFDDRHSSRSEFQLSMERRSSHGHSQNSSSFRFQDFRGLFRPAGGGEAPIQFELVRDAGTFAFTGHVDSTGGSGRFRFTPSAEFQNAWTSSGHSPLSGERIYSMAVHDVSRAFIRDLASLGYTDVSADRLITLRIHGATTEYIREIQALGYTKLPVDQIVTFRIHGVSPEGIRELQAMGYSRVPADQLVTMRIHGADPEFVRSMAELGYEHVPIDSLVSFRIHGVSPEYVRAFRDLGYKRIPADELVTMRIHGVSIEFVRDVQARDRNVSIDDLVSMRIHGGRR